MWQKTSVMQNWTCIGIVRFAFLLFLCVGNFYIFLNIHFVRVFFSMLGNEQLYEYVKNYLYSMFWAVRLINTAVWNYYFFFCVVAMKIIIPFHENFHPVFYGIYIGVWTRWKQETEWKYSNFFQSYLTFSKKSCNFSKLFRFYEPIVKHSYAASESFENIF
mgnify:CR=1 FL=1